MAAGVQREAGLSLLSADTDVISRDVICCVNDLS